MALSSGAAVKAKIETLGLGLAAYRDRPPAGQPLPYVTVHERIDLRPDESGDNGAGVTVRELVQVDLWQQRRNPTTKAMTEDPTLADALAAGLHGSQLVNVGSKRVYGVQLQSSVRVPEKDTNLIHDALTVELSRVL